MRQIDHWSGQGVLQVAESAGGVLATVDPFANLVLAGVALCPTPELMQKLYASDRWRGKSAEDDHAVRQRLGHYCDLQSLNSEDAITWSVFGPLIYGPPEWRTNFGLRLFAAIGLPKPTALTIWLWRRIPHPEKLGSTGGPEIDFGIQSESCLLLGEAKWNSSIGAGQGVLKNRSQLDLRLAHCAGIGRKAMSGVRHWAVLGLGRGNDVLSAVSVEPIGVHNLTWQELIELMPTPLREELGKYVAWKNQFSTKRPNQRLQPTAAP